MTNLLEKAFKRAAKLPENMQDELAKHLLDDIIGEINWDKTLEKSQDKLEQLASNALNEFKSKQTKEMGFDEL